jgi:hypothetical protein
LVLPQSGPTLWQLICTGFAPQVYGLSLLHQFANPRLAPAGLGTAVRVGGPCAARSLSSMWVARLASHRRAGDDDCVDEHQSMAIEMAGIAAAVRLTAAAPAIAADDVRRSSATSL